MGKLSVTTRGFRTIAARCTWAALLFVICFSGAKGAGEAINADRGNILSSDEQTLLEEYFETARNGNYSAAWACVERMFEPAEHSRTLRLLEHCRSDWDDCPEVDFIAWVLGKSKSDLSFMDWFCPAGTSEDECQYWQDWRNDIKAHLGDAPSPPAPMAHELGFLVPWAEAGDMRQRQSFRSLARRCGQCSTPPITGSEYLNSHRSSQQMPTSGFGKNPAGDTTKYMEVMGR